MCLCVCKNGLHGTNIKQPRYQNRITLRILRHTEIYNWLSHSDIELSMLPRHSMLGGEWSSLFETMQMNATLSSTVVVTYISAKCMFGSGLCWCLYVRIQHVTLQRIYSISVYTIHIYIYSQNTQTHSMNMESTYSSSSSSARRLRLRLQHRRHVRVTILFDPQSYTSPESDYWLCIDYTRRKRWNITTAVPETGPHRAGDTFAYNTIHIVHNIHCSSALASTQENHYFYMPYTCWV